jgi:hypothetical protein
MQARLLKYFKTSYKYVNFNWIYLDVKQKQQ